MDVIWRWHRLHPGPCARFEIDSLVGAAVTERGDRRARNRRPGPRRDRGRASRDRLR